MLQFFVFMSVSFRFVSFYLVLQFMFIDSLLPSLLSAKVIFFRVPSKFVS